MLPNGVPQSFVFTTQMVNTAAHDVANGAIPNIFHWHMANVPAYSQTLIEAQRNGGARNSPTYPAPMQATNSRKRKSSQAKNANPSPQHQQPGSVPEFRQPLSNHAPGSVPDSSMIYGNGSAHENRPLSRIKSEPGRPDLDMGEKEDPLKQMELMTNANANLSNKLPKMESVPSPSSQNRETREEKLAKLDRLRRSFDQSAPPRMQPAMPPGMRPYMPNGPMPYYPPQMHPQGPYPMPNGYPQQNPVTSSAISPQIDPQQANSTSGGMPPQMGGYPQNGNMGYYPNGAQQTPYGVPNGYPHAPNPYTAAGMPPPHGMPDSQQSIANVPTTSYPQSSVPQIPQQPGMMPPYMMNQGMSSPRYPMHPTTTNGMAGRMPQNGGMPPDMNQWQQNMPQPLANLDSRVPSQKMNYYGNGQPPTLGMAPNGAYGVFRMNSEEWEIVEAANGDITDLPKNAILDEDIKRYYAERLAEIEEEIEYFRRYEEFLMEVRLQSFQTENE